MKLYATTTSERASKGQGGNQYIQVNLSIGEGAKDSKILARGILSREETGDEKGYKLYFSTETGVDDQCIDYFISDEELKGERRGETCLTCGDSGWVGKTEKCLNCNPLGNHGKGNSLLVVNCKEHGVDHCEHCSKYPQEMVLPDEDGMCSLCGLHEAEKGENPKA